MYRAIDANINRICEGLRVVEDYLRFEITGNNGNEMNSLLNRLKKVRHVIREEIATIFQLRLINARNSEEDPEKTFSLLENRRVNSYDLLKANFLRAEEGLRVLEEIVKLINQEQMLVRKETIVSRIKDNRFEVYELEKAVFLLINRQLKLDLTFYLALELMDETEQELKEIFLSTLESEITALGILPLQTRFSDHLSHIQLIRNLCRDYHKPFLIHNHLDLALILSADGLIIDSDYLPPNEIRKYYQKPLGFYCRPDETTDAKTCLSVDFILDETGSQDHLCSSIPIFYTCIDLPMGTPIKKIRHKIFSSLFQQS